jgi:hypothetical protein
MYYAPRKVSVAERCFEILKYSDKLINEGVVLPGMIKVDDIHITEDDEDEILLFKVQVMIMHRVICCIHFAYLIYRSRLVHR